MEVMLESLLPPSFTTDRSDPSAEACLLSNRWRVAIAMRVCELHDDAESLAHLYRHGAKLDLDDLTLGRFRRGISDDIEEQSLLAIATKVVRDRGHHARLVVDSARAVGLADTVITDALTWVGLITTRCYLSVAADNGVTDTVPAA
jgi:alkylhydroperoxidase family enzyme